MLAPTNSWTSCRSASAPDRSRPEAASSGSGTWRIETSPRSTRRNGPTSGSVSLADRTPTGLAFGLGAIWVAHGRLGKLSRVDAQFGTVTDTIDAAGRGPYSSNGSVAVGAGWVWAAFGDSTLARVDPHTVRVSGSTIVGAQPAGVTVGSRSVWVSNSDSSTVQRFAPETFEEAPLKEFNVGRRPAGIASGEGAIWVAIEGDDEVARIDPVQELSA